MLGLGNSILGGAPSSWSPSDISGLAVWLKNGVGVAIGKWEDSSGNDNWAGQDATDNQAAESGGGLTFDGVDDYYDFNSKVTISTNHNFIVAVVLKINSYSSALSADPQNCILSDGAAEFLELESDKKIRIKTVDPGPAATTSRLTQSSADFAIDTKMVITLSRNDGSTGTLNAYKNGVSIDDSWSNQENPRGIEFSNLGVKNDEDRYFDGSIYELLIYDFGAATHTAEELTNLHTYLNTVHGL
jgi:hypothetical protein